MTRLVGLCVIVLVMLCWIAGLLGCGGGGGADTGAAGYVYVLSAVGASAPQVLPQIVISASATPPEGYEPAVNAVVTLGEELVTTNSLGFYMLTGLPPGVYSLEVDLDDDGVIDIAVTITIIAGEITWGDGHTEGGG